MRTGDLAFARFLRRLCHKICSNQAAEIIGLGMWLSILAWPVILAFALVMKLGEI